MEKLEWCRYPMVKNFEDIFIRFDVIHERDRQTDRRTPGDSKDRAYAYASRGKNRDSRRISGRSLLDHHEWSPYTIWITGLAYRTWADNRLGAISNIHGWVARLSISEQFFPQQLGVMAHLIHLSSHQKVINEEHCRRRRLHDVPRS